jgi:nickel-dependent lactate racemase
LRTQEDERYAADDPRADLPSNIRSVVRLATHHPLARQELSYLGADDYGEPIYVSRHVFDADVVVPIACARLDEALGYGGVSASLYPTFADQSAYERCRNAKANGNGAHPNDAAFRSAAKRSPMHAGRTASNHGRLSKRDAEHVAWLLGVVFCVQALPGKSGNLIDVLAGQYEHVITRGHRLSRDAWSCDIPAPADLVVAAIEGDAGQQTWDNIGRAIAAAQRIVSEKGAIALCTEVAEAPGPGIRAVAGLDNLAQAQRRLQKQKPLDAPAAQQWASALDHSRLFLLSRLREDQVEDIGAAHVVDATEIARLIQNSESCVLLSNAQYVLPTGVET